MIVPIPPQQHPLCSIDYASSRRKEIDTRLQSIETTRKVAYLAFALFAAALTATAFAIDNFMGYTGFCTFTALAIVTDSYIKAFQGIYIVNLNAEKKSLLFQKDIEEQTELRSESLPPLEARLEVYANLAKSTQSKLFELMAQIENLEKEINEAPNAEEIQKLTESLLPLHVEKHKLLELGDRESGCPSFISILFEAMRLRDLMGDDCSDPQYQPHTMSLVDRTFTKCDIYGFKDGIPIREDVLSSIESLDNRRSSGNSHHVG